MECLSAEGFRNMEQTAKRAIIARQVVWNYKLNELEDSAIKQLQTTVNEAKKDITKDLRRFKKRSWSKKRNQEVLAELKKLSAGLSERIRGEIGETAAIVGSESLKRQNAILSFDGRVNINMVALGPEQLRSFFQTTPVGGALLADWVDRSISFQLQDRIKREIDKGILRGKSYQEISKRIQRGFSELSKKEIETLTRTYAHAANVGAMNSVYDANRDIVKGREWNSVLEPGYKTDGRGTCPRCAALDGNIYTDKNRPSILLHPN